MHLYEALGGLVQQWRNQHYPCEDYPAVAEILEWAAHPDVSSFRLRAPQLRALETYWKASTGFQLPRAPRQR
jgi:hypothetical protein